MVHNNGRNGQVARFLTGLLIGSLIGGAVGLLKAPRPGAKTREQIQQKAFAVRDKAEQAVADVRSRAAEVSDQVAQRAESFRLGVR
jgi:gas vesicle protein